MLLELAPASVVATERAGVATALHHSLLHHSLPWPFPSCRRHRAAHPAWRHRAAARDAAALRLPQRCGQHSRARHAARPRVGLTGALLNRVGSLLQ